jgi:hypothetical protein
MINPLSKRPSINGFFPFCIFFHTANLSSLISWWNDANTIFPSLHRYAFDPYWKYATMSFVSKQQLQKEQRLRDQEQQKINSTCDSDLDTFDQVIGKTEGRSALQDAQTSNEQSDDDDDDDDDDDAGSGLSSYASLPVQEAECQWFKRNFHGRPKTPANQRSVNG